MKRFVLSRDAAQDLRDIWEYIAEDSIDAADAFLEKLHDQLIALARTPGIGHKREDLAEDRSLLFCPVGNYLILDRSRKGFVEVVAVAHGKRDIPTFILRRQL